MIIPDGDRTGNPRKHFSAMLLVSGVSFRYTARFSVLQKLSQLLGRLRSMEPYHVENFRRWFDAYVNRFFGEDEYVNVHLRLKHEHTQRTCEETLRLADPLALDDDQKRVAEVIALFHDVGRFPQFAEYRTFDDTKSVDHGRLAVEILCREGVLAALRRQERQWVETAIEHHGRKAIPADLRGRTLLFAKLIRDADKLDIFRVVLEKYRLFREDPAGCPLEIPFPDPPEYSPEVMQSVLNGQLVEYPHVRTLNDVILCRIGWVYDMNFAASLVHVRQRGIFDQLFDSLPQTADVARLKTCVRKYIDTRLNKTPASA